MDCESGAVVARDDPADILVTPGIPRGTEKLLLTCNVSHEGTQTACRESAPSATITETNLTNVQVVSFNGVTVSPFEL